MRLIPILHVLMLKRGQFAAMMREHLFLSHFRVAQGRVSVTSVVEISTENIEDPYACASAGGGLLGYLQGGGGI